MNLPPTDWWQALNPPIYLVSVLPGVAVWLLAGGFSVPVLTLHSVALATAAVVLLQHAVNLFNDAKDWQLGADRLKFDSWVRVHAGKTRPVIVHGAISLMSGALLGLLVLLWFERLWVLWLAVPLVGLGLLYNMGARPLSYTAAGEWVTGLCYGPGVFGGIWYAAGQGNGAVAVLGMLAFAAFAVALLLSHQPPQIETDRAAGKQSFAVRHGARAAYRVAMGLQALMLMATGTALAISGQVSSVVFGYVVASAVALAFIVVRGPNPKRLMLSTMLIFLLVLSLAATFIK